jgi:hypothetical protein
MTTYADSVAVAGQREFDITFPYLDVSHVVVEVRGTPVPYEWINPTRIRLVTAAGDGDVVRRRRATPVSQALVEFQAGATLTETDLNTAVRQTLFVQQELLELYHDNILRARVRLGENLGVVTSPDTLADELVQIALADELLETFRDAISDISLNASSIIEQALRTDGLTSAFGVLEANLLDVDGALEAAVTRVTTAENRVTALTAVVDALVDIGDGEGLATLVSNETVARIAGDEALAEDIALLGAANGSRTAFVLNLNSVRVTSSETLSQRLAALSASDGEARSLILAEQAARSTAVSAVATDLQSLAARVGTAESTIITDRQSRVNGDAALATVVEALTTRMGTAESTIITDRQSRVTGDTALGTRIDSLTTTVGENRAFHIAQVGVLTTNLAAEVTARETLATQVGANAAAINTEQVSRASAIAAEASARQALAARVGTAEAAIQTEATTRATETGSLAATLALLGVRNGDSSAFILDLSKVQVGGGVSMGTRLSGIDTRVGTAEASVASEISARTSADSSLSSRIDTVTSTLNGNTASITSLQAVTNGLSARAGVVLDVNGFVTGWSLNNDGAQGSFSILANRFSIVDPNNGSPFTPFEISGGVVRIRNALIDNLDLVRLGSGVFNGDMDVGTGKIIFDNGTTMMVHGVGFGTANQFLEWSGPSMAINLCSEANGVRWFKTNGDAYFGGSLSIGTLTSKVATSSLAVSPEVETASFGSNGGQITVNLSYNRQIVGRSATAPATGAISATVTLYRSIGGGSYATAVTLTATGTQTAEYDSELGNYLVTANISGSATYSDPSLSTSNRQLKAVVSSRGGVTSLNGGVTGTQNLSIIATEQ